MVGGGVAAVALIAFIDRWGYGYWTSPAWNYFRHTLVEGHVNDTDRGPIWDYLRVSLTETWPLLGPLVFLSFFVACFRSPRDPFVWSALPFMLIHHLVAHKELRFLFPLAQAGPLWLAIAAALVWPWLLRALLAYNVVALAFQTLLPANPRIGLWRAIARSGVGVVYYRETDDPYSVQGLIARFYRPEGLVTLPAPDNSHLGRTRGAFLLYSLWGKGEPAPYDCTLVAWELPRWIEERLPRKVLPNIRDWQLTRCEELPTPIID
jgi:phosphatidylinositol glycan class B